MGGVPKGSKRKRSYSNNPLSGGKLFFFSQRYVLFGRFSQPKKNKHNWLVVEPPIWKNMLVKLGSSSPIFGVKIWRHIWNHQQPDNNQTTPTLPNRWVLRGTKDTVAGVLPGYVTCDAEGPPSKSQDGFPWDDGIFTNDENQYKLTKCRYLYSKYTMPYNRPMDPGQGIWYTVFKVSFGFCDCPTRGDFLWSIFWRDGRFVAKKNHGSDGTFRKKFDQISWNDAYFLKPKKHVLDGVELFGKLWLDGWKIWAQTSFCFPWFWSFRSWKETTQVTWLCSQSMKEKPDSTREAAKASKPFRTRTHDGFMVRFVYLPIHEWLIFMVNIGNYTIVPWHGWYGLEIDSLGTTPFFFFNFLLTNQKNEKKKPPQKKPVVLGISARFQRLRNRFPSHPPFPTERRIKTGMQKKLNISRYGIWLKYDSMTCSISLDHSLNHPIICKMLFKFKRSFLDVWPKKLWNTFLSW